MKWLFLAWLTGLACLVWAGVFIFVWDNFLEEKFHRWASKKDEDPT